MVLPRGRGRDSPNDEAVWAIPSRDRSAPILTRSVLALVKRRAALRVRLPGWPLTPPFSASVPSITDTHPEGREIKTNLLRKKKGGTGEDS